MTRPLPLDLNLATRPLRNRRLFKVVASVLVLVCAVFAALTAFVWLKYGGEASRLKAVSAEANNVRAAAGQEVRNLEADIRRASAAGQARIDLVNAIILKKAFLWTELFSELEKALPGPSYITALSPSLSNDGSVAMHLRVNMRGRDDLSAFITNLTARGFKNISLQGEVRNSDGRLIADIDLRYERAI
jgi:Tfp pilus assembly protein PilN